MYTIMIHLLYILVTPHIYALDRKEPSSDPQRLRRRLQMDRPHSCDLSLSLQTHRQFRATSTPQAETDPEFTTAKNINEIITAKILSPARKSQSPSCASSSSSSSIIPRLALHQKPRETKLLNMCFRALGLLELAKKRYPDATNIDKQIQTTIKHIKALDPSAQNQEVPNSARQSSGRKRLWRQLNPKTDTMVEPPVPAHPKIKRTRKKAKRHKKKDDKGKGKARPKRKPRSVPKISLNKIGATSDVEDTLELFRQVAILQAQSPASSSSSSSSSSKKLSLDESKILQQNLMRLSQKHPHPFAQQDIFLNNTFALIDTACSLIQPPASPRKKESPRRFIKRSPRKTTNMLWLQQHPVICQKILSLLLPTFPMMAEQYILESRAEHKQRLTSYIKKAVATIKELESSGFQFIIPEETARNIEACHTILHGILTPHSTRTEDTELSQLQETLIDTIRHVRTGQKTIVISETSDVFIDRWDHDKHVGSTLLIKTTITLLQRTERCDDLVKLNTAIAHIPLLKNHLAIVPLIQQTQLKLFENVQAARKLRSPRK